MIPGYVREVEYLEHFDRPRPRGYRLVVVDEFIRRGMDWRPAAPGRRCRWTIGPGHATCKAPAVAELLRGRAWWGYCERHLYGRIWDAEHQRLLAAVLVPENEAP